MAHVSFSVGSGDGDIAFENDNAAGSRLERVWTMGTALLERPAPSGAADTNRELTARRDLAFPRDGVCGQARPRERRVRVLLKRLVYHGWRKTPQWGQRLAVRLLEPRITLGACAIVQDPEGRVLLAHHTYRKRGWGLPGGFVGRQEQAVSALERELREELDVAARIGPVLYAETNLPSHHLTLYFRARIMETPRPDMVEIDGFRFAPLDEVAALLGQEAMPWLNCLRQRRAS